MKSWMNRGAVALTMATAALAYATTASAQDTTSSTTTTTAQPAAQPAAQPSTTVVQPAPAQPAQPAPTTNNTITVTPQQQPSGQTETTSGFVNPTHQKEETETGYAPNRYLLTSGLIVFGVPYVSSIVVAASSDHSGDNHLYVPLVGPWMDLADRGPTNGSDTETTNKVLLGVDGVFQAIGALQIVGAFVFPETKQVTTVPATAYTPEMTISPTKLGRDGYGLAALATF